MDISTKISESIQERPQMQISSDQDHSYKKRQYNNTNIYSVFWDKEKERLSHVIDLYYKYEMLVEDRQEFTKNYQNKYADQVSIWFEDEMKNNIITTKLQKIIAVLQNIDNKLIWNLNCITTDMGIIKVHIEDESHSILKFEKINLFDIVRKI